MKKFAIFVAPLLLVLALALTACGKSVGPGGDEYASPNVTMGQTDYDHHALKISAGTTVKFETAASGATHILCIGENGSCQAGATGPAELTKKDGETIDPGKSVDIKFDAPGTYKVACIVHPNMNLTITVS